MAKCFHCKQDITGQTVILEHKTNKKLKKQYHQICFEDVESYKNTVDFLYKNCFDNVFPPVMAKHLKNLSEQVRLKYVYEYLLDNYQTIKPYIDKKEFKNVSGKSSYIIAIIKNNIDDYIKNKLKLEKLNNIENEINFIDRKQTQYNNNNFDIFD